MVPSRNRVPRVALIAVGGRWLEGVAQPGPLMDGSGTPSHPGFLCVVTARDGNGSTEVLGQKKFEQDARVGFSNRVDFSERLVSNHSNRQFKGLPSMEGARDDFSHFLIAATLQCVCDDASGSRKILELHLNGQKDKKTDRGAQRADPETRKDARRRKATTG